jgi:hypothetical protein
MPNFKQQPDGTYIRTITINNTIYRLTVQSSVWETKKVSNHVTYWIRRIQNGHMCHFKYGTVTITHPEHVLENTCTMCKRSYKTRSGLLRHIKIYHNDVLENERTETPITNITNHNIQINLPQQIRNFSDENQKWLTHNVLMEAISDIPTAIPYLIREKHFNDNFPENQNVRLENKRSINKRLKVYHNGMWRVKDRPDVEYRVIEQVYNILYDFVELMSEDDVVEEEINETATPLERRIADITRRIRTSEIRRARVMQSLRGWKQFEEHMKDDYEKTIEPFKDKMDTFLLDTNLKLEQLRERRDMLMNSS